MAVFNRKPSTSVQINTMAPMTASRNKKETAYFWEKKGNARKFSCGLHHNNVEVFFSKLDLHKKQKNKRLMPKKNRDFHLPQN